VSRAEKVSSLLRGRPFSRVFAKEALSGLSRKNNRINTNEKKGLRPSGQKLDKKEAQVAHFSLTHASLPSQKKKKLIHKNLRSSYLMFNKLTEQQNRRNKARVDDLEETLFNF
jgi:hypothetical protein